MDFSFTSFLGDVLEGGDVFEEEPGFGVNSTGLVLAELGLPGEVCWRDIYRIYNRDIYRSYKKFFETTIEYIVPNQRN